MLTLATFNLCNLGADAPAERLKRLAAIIVDTLNGPDILAVQEIKALGLDDARAVPADAAYRALIEAITAAGGPGYTFREVPPLADREGGHPGFNIRTGLLLNPQRVEFAGRGQAGPEDATAIRLVDGRPALTLNPGRIAPVHPAFAGDSRRHWLPNRRVLVAEFWVRGERLFVIACHLKSMRSATRRESAYTKKQRHAQAEAIHCFVANLLACDPQARLVVLGDMNDVRGSKTLKILEGNLLNNLLEEVPKGQCYTRRHGREPQTLDHILVSRSLHHGAAVRIPHVNTDAPEQHQVSDHDPVLAVLDL